MADTHATAKAPTVPTDGTFPYWTTRCGKRLDSASLHITDQSKLVTCAKCKVAK